MEDKRDRKPNNTQHKIFKATILIIVAVFFFLIFYFINVEFFHKSDKDYIFNINSEKYLKLDSYDRKRYTSSNIENCNIDKFYINNVSEYMPCKLKANKKFFDLILKNLNEIKYIDKVRNKYNSNIENTFSIEEVSISNDYMLEIADFMNLEKMFLKYSVNMLNIPTFYNKDYMILQLKGKKTFSLSPISQVNFLKPYRDQEIKSLNIFNPIKFRDNIYLSNSNLIKLQIEIDEGEILYIPSYLIAQEVSFNESISLVYEYSSNSKLLDKYLKVLLDNNNINESEI